MIRLHIFDVDGTLLDSMPLWENLGRNYLKAHGGTIPGDLDERLETLTIDESARWFHEELGIRETPAQIQRGFLDMIRKGYEEEVPAMPGAEARLKMAAASGAPLVVLSTSDEGLIKAAFKRLGFLKYFSQIYTSGRLGLGKDGPGIFRAVCDLEDVEPAEAMVYEDSDFAIRAAREAGCQVTVIGQAEG